MCRGPHKGLRPCAVGCAHVDVGFSTLKALAARRASQKYKIWLHVDAAYAGAAMVAPEMRWAMEGVEKADSFDMNPHKWMLVNFDCSALFVRDRAPLVQALTLTPAFLQNR